MTHVCMCSGAFSDAEEAPVSHTDTEPWGIDQPFMTPRKPMATWICRNTYVAKRKRQIKSEKKTFLQPLWSAIWISQLFFFFLLIVINPPVGRAFQQKWRGNKFRLSWCVQSWIQILSEATMSSAYKLQCKYTCGSSKMTVKVIFS